MNAEQLRRKRGIIKAKLTSAKNFADKVIENPNASTREEIEARIKILDEAHAKFQAISEQLLSATTEEEFEQRDVEEEAEFDERYAAIKAALKQCLENLQPPTPTASVNDEGQISNAALMQLLELQVRFMQQLTERSTDVGDNEVLLRVVEQQNRMMKRWNLQSSTPRESPDKIANY